MHILRIGIAIGQALWYHSGPACISYTSQGIDCCIHILYFFGLSRLSAVGWFSREKNASFYTA